jgi:hypothetical protein
VAEYDAKVEADLCLPQGLDTVSFVVLVVDLGLVEVVGLDLAQVVHDSLVDHTG